MGRSVLHWVSVCALGALPLVGCTDVFETVTLSVTVTEAPSFDGNIFGGPPLEGVELCETDTTNCATTDPNGVAQIELPANQEISFTLEKEGYVPLLVGDVTDGTLPSQTWAMASDELAADFSEINMIPYPWKGGIVGLAVLPRMAGVTFDLVDETARGFYADEEGSWSLDATATTSTGLGGFVEVPPGEYQVEFGGTATFCAPVVAWPGDAATESRSPSKLGPSQ